MINPFEFMKQFGYIKERFKNLHLEELQASGEAGGGLVRLTLNGKFQMVDLQLDAIAVDNRDVPMLQDLIIAAHNDASYKIMETIKGEIGKELGIPGMQS